MAIIRFPVELTWSGQPGGPGVNVFHMRVDDSDVEANVGQLSGALQSFYQSISGFLAPGLVSSSGDPIDVETNEPVPLGNPWTISPSPATTALPAANQLAIKWSTSQRTRRGTGRTFLGPLSIGTADASGKVATGALNSIQAVVNDLVADSQAVLGAALGVYGYQSAKLSGATRGPDEPRVLRDFTAGTVSSKFAVLRSRRD